MARDAFPTGPVAFLYTDIEGSTRRGEAPGPAMGAAVARHDALLRRAIADHGGVVFKTVGDAFCAVFAMRGAIAISGIVLNDTLQSTGTPFSVAYNSIFGGDRGGELIDLFAAISGIGALNGCTMIKGAAGHTTAPTSSGRRRSPSHRR